MTKMLMVGKWALAALKDYEAQKARGIGAFGERALYERSPAECEASNTSEWFGSDA